MFFNDFKQKTPAKLIWKDAHLSPKDNNGINLQ